VLRLCRECVQHRQVERERLAGCGAGGDDQVLAALGRLPRARLMLVELGDALTCERRADVGVEPVG